MGLCYLFEGKRIRPLSYKQKGKLDFVKPEYEIERIDSYDRRQKILNIFYVDWKKLGFSKETVHYMKQNAKSDKPFTLMLMYWKG